MHSDWEERAGIEILARAAGVSRRQLARWLRLRRPSTPQEWLNQLRARKPLVMEDGDEAERNRRFRSS